MAGSQELQLLCLQAMIAVGAGGLAVNAVKGIFGGNDDSHDSHSEHNQKVTTTGIRLVVYCYQELPLQLCDLPEAGATMQQ